MSNLAFADLPTKKPSLSILHKSTYDNNASTMLIIFIVIFGIVFGLIFLMPIEGKHIVAGLMLAMLLVASVIAALYSAFHLKLRNKQTQFDESFGKFLATNNFSLGVETDIPATTEPFIYGIGSRNETARAFSGIISSRPFSAYVYTYFKKTKNSENSYPFTVFRFSLSKSLPHLVLDSRKNDGIISGIPRFFSDDQRIELEGDFNNYFDLFAPRDYEIEALDILSPDFMQMLMDFHTDFDVEINKTEVYLISKGINYDQQSMQEVFKAAEVLIEKFNHKLKVWSMAAMAKNLPELDSHIDESAIRIGGKRITTAVFTIPLISLYFAVRVSENVFNIWIFLGSFALCVSVMIMFRRFKRKRN